MLAEIDLVRHCIFCYLCFYIIDWKNKNKFFSIPPTQTNTTHTAMHALRHKRCDDSRKSLFINKHNLGKIDKPHLLSLSLFIFNISVYSRILFKSSKLSFGNNSNILRIGSLMFSSDRTTTSFLLIPYSFKYW